MNKIWSDIAWDDQASDGSVWQSVLFGTDAAGLTLSELWDEYISSDFSKLSSNADEYGGKSELNEMYDVRNRLKQR